MTQKPITLVLWGGDLAGRSRVSRILTLGKPSRVSTLMSHVSLRRVLCCAHLNWVGALGISNFLPQVRGISWGIRGFREQFEVGCNQFMVFVLCSVSYLTSPQILNMIVNPGVNAEDVTLELGGFLGHIHKYTQNFFQFCDFSYHWCCTHSFSEYPSICLSVCLYMFPHIYLSFHVINSSWLPNLPDVSKWKSNRHSKYTEAETGLYVSKSSLPSVFFLHKYMLLLSMHVLRMKVKSSPLALNHNG